MSLIDAALQFETSRRIQRVMGDESRRFPWPTRMAHLHIRQIARSLARYALALRADLEEERKKKDYLIGVRFKFEEEVDNLEAENRALRAKLGEKMTRAEPCSECGSPYDGVHRAVLRSEETGNFIRSSKAYSMCSKANGGMFVKVSDG